MNFLLQAVPKAICALGGKPTFAAGANFQETSAGADIGFELPVQRAYVLRSI